MHSSGTFKRLLLVIAMLGVFCTAGQTASAQHPHNSHAASSH
jgi:hypothetical protein